MLANAGHCKLFMFCATTWRAGTISAESTHEGALYNTGSGRALHVGDAMYSMLPASFWQWRTCLIVYIMLCEPIQSRGMLWVQVFASDSCFWHLFSTGAKNYEHPTMIACFVRRSGHVLLVALRELISFFVSTWRCHNCSYSAHI